ncbi:UDP-N-acetylmuramoylalanyl-D-glutamyl-2,6-diaminopimelate--D-alanyl-D-alanine ligase [Pararhizobium mangrovi]|uniref:UDP-N-acetylmuramoyl-tripeptide--D-alanyl-D-alanine ligase n=1 Tax=Pararhizobium mangrovi TaxID=2590452 RepID=A0A506U603_9HYPH|nr:UDP-N-acetylmuramoylalanyl-D-glutamyl-2,6-diaminopimelate--D-alanyl-D-alanine ligase [Pararhizobium mangrovi]TPW29280.1 UDP-N-acetylmuramoylalanyl-D-glutamyl-2,6-diaminopimelate--D-alanyl-D-alanine ligase [Pararhizobium mangrovi]
MSETLGDTAVPTCLWTSRAMVEALQGRPVGSLPAGVNGISIDTRTLRPGDAFFAIAGDRFDGHDFASAAVAAEAGLLVVSEAKLPALGGLTVPMIVVDDVLAALERLGRAARERSDATILAVTGSVGKTTTKAMLARALAPSGETHAAVASFNNHWGVPLTLARMPESARFGIFEIGMNHAGEIRALVDMVRPHIAMVTTIAPAHLGHFESLEAIAAAKAEIFEGLVPGGTAMLNRDNAQFEVLRAAAEACGVERILTFGEDEAADFRLLQVRLEGDGSHMRAAIGGDVVEAHIGAPGRHVVQNALAVLGAASIAGADIESAASALADVKAEKGRGARHRLAHSDGVFVLIDESYNANPTSVGAAVALLAATPVGPGGRRIAVLGDMLELGVHTGQLHRELAGPIIEAGIDRVYLAGSAMTALQEALDERIAVRHLDDAAAIAEALKREIAAGDVVMVKASLGLGFGPIVTALTDTFPAEGRAPGDATAEEPAATKGS